MKTLRSLYLWTIGSIVFGFFLFFGLLASYLMQPKRFNPALQLILRFLFKVMHIPVKVEGKERLDPKKTYLFMSNHVSLFDIPLLGGYVPGYVRGVEATRQHRWPVYGWAMGRLGNIPIERDNIHRSFRTIEKTADLIKNGQSMIILPEGSRTLDGQLRPFKKLPFYLAKKAGVEIIPVGISGLFTLKPKGTWHIHPTNLKIKFGGALSVSEINLLSAEELREMVRSRIMNLIEYP